MSKARNLIRSLEEASPKFKKGDVVIMTADAIDNYGSEYEGVPLVVTHVATKYMPSKDFYAKGRPDGYHPGYDEGAGGGLYDLKVKSTGKELGMSLYDWELRKG